MKPIHLQVTTDVVVARREFVDAKVEIDLQPVWLHRFNSHRMCECSTADFHTRFPCARGGVAAGCCCKFVESIRSVRAHNARCNPTLRILKLEHNAMGRRQEL